MSESIVARLREYRRAAADGQWDWSWTDEDEKDAPDFWIEAGGEPIMRGGRDVHDAVLIVNAVNNLGTLLSIVERFAASDPLRVGTGPYLTYCSYCGARGNRVGDEQGLLGVEHPHADDCPWLAARRACGMEDAE